MATKSIITRIQNKVDSYSAWKDSTGKLLNGEIAIVRVPTGETYTNPVTGKTEPVVELLMKVGDGKNQFAALPWLSAKASDVYNWAKSQTVEEVNVKVVISVADNGDITYDTKNIGEWFKSFREGIAQNASDIAGLSSGKLDDISVNVTGDTGVVKSVTKGAKGVVEVSKSLVGTNDIDNSAVTETKIATDAVTTGKIKNGAVTNAKLGDDISSDKINIDGGNLTAKISGMETSIGNLRDGIAGGVHFRGIVENEPGESTVQVNGYDVTAGTVVIYSGKEYICVKVESAEVEGEITKKATWEQLGDVTRIGNVEQRATNLENAIAALNYDDKSRTDNDHKFARVVTQENGLIEVDYVQPDATDIKYGESSSVAAALGAHQTEVDKLSDITGTGVKVGATIDSKISAARTLMVHTTEGSGDFVTNVTQANGIVTVTKGNLPVASTSTAGIVKLSDTISGDVVANDSTTAATTKAVKNVQTNAADALTRVGNVETNYVKFVAEGTSGKLVVGKDGADVIIFDCGGAADL